MGRQVSRHTELAIEGLRHLLTLDSESDRWPEIESAINDLTAIDLMADKIVKDHESIYGTNQDIVDSVVEFLRKLGYDGVAKALNDSVDNMTDYDPISDL